MAEAPYLSDPAFSEAHTGPDNVDANGTEHGRNPSPDQIADMCRAIRRTWNETREIQALGRTAGFDTWHRRRRMSEATHVPHGISSRSIGSREGDLEIYGTPTGGGQI